MPLPLSLDWFMRRRVYPALILMAHTAACALAVAIVPALLYLRVGSHLAHYSDWLFAHA